MFTQTDRDPAVLEATTAVQDPENRRASNGIAGGWLHGVADPVRLGLLQGLIALERATAAELAARCQASMPTLRRHLDALVAIGLIEQEAGESDGETQGRPAAQFSINPELRPSVESVFRPSC